MVNDPTNDANPEHGEPDDLTLGGNRPADNALRASAESELNKSWQGGEGAADFLGLDEELRAPIEHPPILPAQPESAPVFNPESELSGSFAAEEPASLVEPGLDATHLDETIDDQVDPGMPLTDEEPNWLLDSEVENMEEDFADESHEIFQEEGGRRSPLRLLAISGTVLAACAGAWYFGFRETQPQFEPSTQVSSVPTQQRPTQPTNTEPAPVDTGTTEVAEAGTDASPEKVAETGLANAEPQALPEPTASDPVGDKLIAELTGLIAQVEGPLETVTGPNGPVLAGAQGGESVGEGDPNVENVNSDRVERVVRIDPSEMFVLPDYKSSLRLASEADLAAMWTETTIPFEQMKGPERLLTPNVGRVRVVISGDEIFEGDLYAVGDGQVWVETRIGRVALSSASVQDVQQLAGNEHTPELGGADSGKLAGLPRVRVRSAGGNFYGKVVAQEGDLVTLIPDSGGRIRLQSREVQIVGNMRTSLIREDGE